MAYPNAALKSICYEILREWKLSPDEIKNLAADIPGECERYAKILAEVDQMDFALASVEG